MIDLDGALGFNDIIKKSILQLQNFGDLSLVNVLIALAITLVVALFIFYIYKSTFQGVVYSHSFNTSLVLLSLVTSLVIMTISSNVVLSLGMVGALSIVRFRAAIKDPKDIVFMFWAIAAGIAAGAGVYAVALGGSLFIGLILVLLSGRAFQSSMYLLIIKYEESAVNEVYAILENVQSIANVSTRNTRKVGSTKKLNYVLKSKTVANGKTEITLELRSVGQNTSFVERLTEITGVESAILVQYNGEYSE